MPEARASRSRLRVGLFADTLSQPRWLVAAFAKVAAEDCAEIVLAATGDSGPAAAPWAWRLYGRLDRKLFGSGPDLSARVDLKAGLPPVTFSAMPARDGAAAAAWRARIAALDLDVAFALGEIDDAMLDGLARYGVWRYRYGAELASLEAYAGAREVTDAAPVTASGLSARVPGDIRERLVYQSWSRTFPYSIGRNRDNLQRKSIEFAARGLRQLHRCGPAWFADRPVVAGVRRDRQEALPGSAEILGGLARLGARIAWRGLEKIYAVDQWIIGYRFGPQQRWDGDLRSYRLLLPPRDRYWADPFPYERAGRHYIFFEEFMFATGRAHIVAVEVGADGSCSAPVKVLERPYHLSYPLLVEDGGELYMIPETGANRAVELYRCVRFPDQWRFEKVLLRGARFVDATIHRADGRWWMFVNAGADGAELHDELHLYHAESLLGEWRPHAANPVKSDVRSARPAGRLYERDGALYRPAQICAPLYGTGISINRVLELSPGAYREEEEERVLPTHPSGLLGLHTVNRAGALSVVDAFVRRPRWSAGRAGAAEPERLVRRHATITEHTDNPHPSKVISQEPL
jgi:hypothetical protein